MVNAGDGTSQRAPRYPISVPLKFREDAGPWNDGTSVNMSSRGLLFRTAAAVRVSAAIDVHLTLERGAAIDCRGRVVRTQPCAGPHESLVAMAIHRYKLGRDASTPQAEPGGLPL